MKKAIKLLLFILDEGMRGLLVHRWLRAFALLTVTIALFVLGFSLLIKRNLGKQVQRWESQVTVDVFLLDSCGPPCEEAVITLAKKKKWVAKTRSVSQEEALEFLRRYMPELAPVADEVGGTPLPASVEITLGILPPSGELEIWAQEIKTIPGVEQVQWDQAWVSHLRTYTNYVSGLGWILAVVLGIAAIFTLSAVIRILMLARRDEIEILRLMGATSLAVRGPFVVEGAAMGVSAALLSLGGLVLVWLAMRHGAQSGAIVLGLLSDYFLSPSVCVGLVTLGGGLGAFGGGISFIREMRV